MNVMVSLLQYARTWLCLDVITSLPVVMAVYLIEKFANKTLPESKMPLVYLMLALKCLRVLRIGHTSSVFFERFKDWTLLVTILRLLFPISPHESHAHPISILPPSGR